MTITRKDLKIISNYIDRKIGSLSRIEDAGGGSLSKDVEEYLMARSPKTLAGILRMLASNENEWVREAVASNPNTPTEALLFLAEDKDEWVRESALKNPNYPK